MITVVRTGPLALVQDLGRPGLAALGVSGSGAADRGAHRLANRLVGNPVGAATVEVALGGLAVTTDEPVWCAVTGPGTGVQIGTAGPDRTGAEQVVGSHRRLLLDPGRTLRLDPPRRGLRSYLAVRGGFEPAAVLGSRSTDVLAGLGPEPLRAGDRLPVGSATAGPVPVVGFVPPTEPPDELWLTRGPRHDRLTAAGWRTLLGVQWQVSPDSNRVGLRLTGPVLERTSDAELPSEGVLPGAVQLPPSGQPVVFGPDHPVTGGYPVVAVLTAASCDAAAQLRGGDRVRLRLRPGAAHPAYPATSA